MSHFQIEFYYVFITQKCMFLNAQLHIYFMLYTSFKCMYLALLLYIIPCFAIFSWCEASLRGPSPGNGI